MSKSVVLISRGNMTKDISAALSKHQNNHVLFIK